MWTPASYSLTLRVAMLGDFGLAGLIPKICERLGERALSSELRRRTFGAPAWERWARRAAEFLRISRGW